MLKNIFDRTLSFFGLLFFLPLMGIIAVIIKVTSPGGAIFKQKRVTKGLKIFYIYKFRTMRVDFDKDAKGIQIKGNSSAITPVGKFLRKTKLDELPQLWNILKGDMSFVGPRPELPRRLKYYSEEDKKVFSVKSGITSPASILLSNEEYLMNQVDNPEKYYIEVLMPFKIELNIEYIRDRDILFDIFLIFYTLKKPKKYIYDRLRISQTNQIKHKEEIKNNKHLNS